MHKSVPKQDTDRYVSPLTKMSTLKIPFTEVPKKIQPKDSFTAFMNNLLSSVGLLDETVIDLETNNEPSVTVNNISKSTSPPPAPLISNKHQKTEFESAPEKPKLQLFTKMTQTEIFKCADCEKRRKILYKTVGTFCGNDNMSYSVSTQVSDDDFHNKLPKNQSLAALTPAQLLAQTSGTRRYPEDDLYAPKSSSLSSTLSQMSSIKSGFSRISEFIPPPSTRFLPPERDRDQREEPPYGGSSQYSGVTRGRGSLMDDPRFGNYY